MSLYILLPAICYFSSLKFLIYISSHATGGIAARASEINTETAYALNLFNTKIPQPIEELLVSLPDAGVCLVDHQQVSQLNKSIDVSTVPYRAALFTSI